MRRIAKWIAVLGTVIGCPVSSQTLDEVATFESLLRGETTLSFERLTSEGKFAGCELEFVRLIEDVRSPAKDMIKVSGVVIANYFPGKQMSALLKVKTSTLRSGEGRLEAVDFQPARAQLSIDGVLDGFERKRWICEGEDAVKRFRGAMVVIFMCAPSDRVDRNNRRAGRLDAVQ